MLAYVTSQNFKKWFIKNSHYIVLATFGVRYDSRFALDVLYKKFTKLLMDPRMSSLPVSMKRIPSRTTEKKWQHRFFFQIISLSVAMETNGRIWPNFDLIQAFMHVLIAYKYEKDQMKNNGENVMTSFSPL